MLLLCGRPLGCFASDHALQVDISLSQYASAAFEHLTPSVTALRPGMLLLFGTLADYYTLDHTPQVSASLPLLWH
jgi:hypothetical protein